jgi:hypothetical protein
MAESSLQTYYYYHPETFIFEKTVRTRFAAPPEHATLVVPEMADYSSPVWNGESWDLVPDYRGHYIVQENGVSQLVTELGPIPEGWTLAPEPSTKDPVLVTKEELQAIDRESIRALRAIVSGQSTQEDVDKLSDLEHDAQELRGTLPPDEEN